MLLHCK